VYLRLQSCACAIVPSSLFWRRTNALAQWSVSLVIIGLFLATPAVAQQPSAKAGKTLFDANCSVCHLATGAGGVNFGGVISADLRAPGLEATYYNNDTLLLRAILHGKDQDGQPLHPPMPVWVGRLSSSQAADIIAYLKTLH
jgi:mono/diheme cytochrome c family protein